MASFNRVILLGNVTRDPEVRYTTGGTAVTELGLAVNRFWTDKSTNERKEETTFVDVTLWGRTAEVAGEYLSKGRPVLVEGRLQLDQWEDKESGQKRSRLRVVGETMQLLSSGRPDAAGASSETPKHQAPGKTFTARDQPDEHRPPARSPDQEFYDNIPDGPAEDELPF